MFLAISLKDRDVLFEIIETQILLFVLSKLFQNRVPYTQSLSDSIKIMYYNILIIVCLFNLALFGVIFLSRGKECEDIKNYIDLSTNKEKWIGYATTFLLLPAYTSFICFAYSTNYYEKPAPNLNPVFSLAYIITFLFCKNLHFLSILYPSTKFDLIFCSTKFVPKVQNWSKFQALLSRIIPEILPWRTVQPVTQYIHNVILSQLINEGFSCLKFY